MKIAIVGVSGSKLDDYEKNKAILEIIKIGQKHKDAIIVSGHSPRGGVDILAEMYCKFCDRPIEVFKPDACNWEAYKKRNIQIAEACDELYCITTIKKDKACYHCKSLAHEKTGGCWTMKQAQKLGKKTKLIVLS